MQMYGFIEAHTLPSSDWFIINQDGVILDCSKHDAYSVRMLTAGTRIPNYWVKHCNKWYSTLEELCNKHSIDLL